MGALNCLSLAYKNQARVLQASTSEVYGDPEVHPQVEEYRGSVNTTGIKNLDAIQTGELCKEAMIFSKDVISQNGFFISKIFMGSTFNEIVALGKKIFKEVKVFKPQSSRKDSKESFIICKKIR